MKYTAYSACYINTTEVWGFQNTDAPQLRSIAVICKNPVLVHMLPYKGPPYPNTVSNVRIIDCILSMSDLKELSIASGIRFISITNNKYLQENAGESKAIGTLCQVMDNVVKFTYWNTGIDHPNIQEVFSCSSEFKELAEIVVKNMSLTRVPDEFVTLFPNLQSLELSYNNLTKPPSIFPWTNTELSLPKNLSHSFFMMRHFRETFNVHIEPNKFLRLFNLEHNNIKHLTDFAFHGYLQIINMKGNGMLDISEKAFHKVTGLQNLDLSNNELTSLPEALVSGLSDLHRLDVSANKLTSLPDEIFSNVTALEYLSLAHNSLTVLQPGLFSALKRLEVLRLEYNRLTTLQANTFPVDSLALETVLFSNNPITDLPEFIFWIRNLRHAHFQSTEISLDNFTEFLMAMDITKLEASITESSSNSGVKDLRRRAEILRTVNLESCKITSFHLKRLSDDIKRLILILLQHFRFLFMKNPLKCDCKILPMKHLLHEFRKNGLVAENEYYFQYWICAYPQELQDMRLLSVKDEETYCPLENIANCPKRCKCFKRSVTKTIIVDCRNWNRVSVDGGGYLELWFMYSNKEMLSVLALAFSEILDLSLLTSTGIAFNIFSQFWKLSDNNPRTDLAESLDDLNLHNIEIMHDRLQCSCESLPMKHYVLPDKHIIMNWKAFHCTFNATGYRRLTNFKDKYSICVERMYAINFELVLIVVFSVVLVFITAFLFRRLWYSAWKQIHAIFTPSTPHLYSKKEV